MSLAGARRGLPFVLLLGLPLVVALVQLRDPRWYPHLELAQTEIHVRDVGTPHTPLTGLIGRIAAPQGRGSHPGPLSFYALAGVYRLFGASAWALQVATVALNLLAITTALWIAHRRGRLPLVLGVGAALAVLLRYYGTGVLTVPWNPYLPVLWWVVFLLAIWSVLDEDIRMLPIAVVAGCLCTQTHISYVGLTLGTCAFAITTVMVRRHRRGGDESEEMRPRPVAWLLMSAALGVALWLPPVLEAMTHRPSNLKIVYDYFREPPEASIGNDGVRLFLAHLHPGRLLTDRPENVVLDLDSSPLPGLLFLSAWAATVVIAWRLRHRSLLRLHLTLGVATLLAAVSASRIHGLPWSWLLLWTWGLMALLGLAMIWTVASALERRLTGTTRAVAMKGGVLALVGVALVSTARLTADAARYQLETPEASVIVGRLTPSTAAALADVGRSGSRYLVAWDDPQGIVGPLVGWGLVDELDRRGFRVGTVPREHLRAAPYLTLQPSDAKAEVHVVIGSAVDEWNRRADARRLAHYEPRTDRQRVEHEELRAQVKVELNQLGLVQISRLVDAHLLMALFQVHDTPRVPTALRAKLDRLFQDKQPAAVFLIDRTRNAQTQGRA